MTWPNLPSTFLGGQKLRRRNPQWARRLWGTVRRELSASPGLDLVGKLSVPACPGSLPYSRLFLPSTRKTPSFSLGMCSVLGIRCYSGSCCCVKCSVAHETAILHWFPTPLHEFIINSFIMLLLREIPDCRPWEVYPGLSLQLFGKWEEEPKHGFNFFRCGDLETPVLQLILGFLCT